MESMTLSGLLANKSLSFKSRSEEEGEGWGGTPLSVTWKTELLLQLVAILEVNGHCLMKYLL